MIISKLKHKKFHLPFIFFLALILSACAKVSAIPAKKECVVLLHGMGRTSFSMSKLDKFLSAKGYQTVNFGYPSTKETVKDIAEKYIPQAIDRCNELQPEKIHFVTHSLGGIVVRQYLQTNSLPYGSRIVMISPPSKGSELVDYLKDFWLYKWMNGPPGQELGTGPNSTPNTLLPVNAEIGIITGDKSFNPMFSQLIPGPDDGKVSVERSKLEEMQDFIVIPATHTFIMKNSTALKQVLYFLENGKFKK
ncbi:alpha/beta fold hydrolase [Desulfobacterales bacterium HSG17]|nr:alpha/beta fold hydrolase [Desulfobacterales bacterium HSG17]